MKKSMKEKYYTGKSVPIGRRCTIRRAKVCPEFCVNGEIKDVKEFFRGFIVSYSECFKEE